MTSFSLRLPAGEDPLIGRHDESIWPERVDRYFHATGVMGALRGAFADPYQDKQTTHPEGGFELLPVGQLLDPQNGAMSADSPLTLRHPERSPARTTAFDVGNLVLPSLFTGISAGPFERDSWRPVLLAGPAFEHLQTDGNEHDDLNSTDHSLDDRQKSGTKAVAHHPVNANDTIVVWRGEEDSQASLLIRYLATAFGQRRSYLFAPSFATRIHNIFLPLGCLTDTRIDHDPAERRTSRQLIVVPFVTLIGSAADRSFRRTVTVTLVLLPVESKASDQTFKNLRLRSMEDSEVVDIAAQWDWSPARMRKDTTEYQLGGHLRSYLASSSHLQEMNRGEFTLRSLAESLLINSAASTCLGRDPNFNQRSRSIRAIEECRHQISTEALQSLHIAKTSTILPWFDPAEGEDPSSQAEREAASLANLLFSTQRLPLRDEILTRFALPESPIPEGSFVGAYYVATHAALVYSYVCAGANSQRRGPIWMAAYVSYLGVALSSIRAALLAVDREVDRVKDTPDQLLSTAETLVELEEVFDLQFAVKTHRTYYEEIRKRDGALGDYEWLVKKVSLLRDEAMLRRQHTETQRVLIATVMIATLTAVLAIPGALDLLTTSSDTSQRHRWGVILVAIAAAAVGLGVVISAIPGLRAVRRWIISIWVSWKVRRP